MFVYFVGVWPGRAGSFPQAGRAPNLFTISLSLSLTRTLSVPANPLARHLSEWRTPRSKSAELTLPAIANRLIAATAGAGEGKSSLTFLQLSIFRSVSSHVVCHRFIFRPDTAQSREWDQSSQSPARRRRTRNGRISRSLPSCPRGWTSTAPFLPPSGDGRHSSRRKGTRQEHYPGICTGMRASARDLENL